MPIFRLFRSASVDTRGEALYDAAVAQARQPALYAARQVPDTLDGRFELVALHVFLILHRLKRTAAPGPAIAQALVDHMFADMDRSLREMGTGDLGVGRRVKAMAKAFYGRVAAYESALAAAPGALENALRRNAYGTIRDPGGVTAETLAAMALYVRDSVDRLARTADDEVLAGTVRFADLEAGRSGH